MTTSDLPPPEYRHLTLLDLLRLYTGPDALPVPAPLVAWVEAAVEWQRLVEAEREVADLEARLT